jgi:hypothetical protein
VLALLNWRLWVGLALVAALAFSHLTAYRKGKHEIRLQWDASVAAADQEARRLENARQSRVDDVVRLASARANDDLHRARSVDDADSRMRDTLDAVERAAKASGDAAAKAAAALGADLRSCVARYQQLGKDAAGFASDSLMYQQAWPDKGVK